MTHRGGADEMQFDDQGVDNHGYGSKVDSNNKKSKSSFNAKGSRYFQVDEGYDKRVYENDFKNVIVIILVFIVFYGLNILYWWGMVAFGTCFATEAQWYSVAMFVFTIFWIGGMLISGYYSNKKLHRWEFYLEKINDREQALREQKQREDQRREQEAKLAKQRGEK